MLNFDFALRELDENGEIKVQHHILSSDWDWDLGLGTWDLGPGTWDLGIESRIENRNFPQSQC